MKNLLLTFLLVGALSVGAARAQNESPISLYTGGLISIPNSPDNFDNNYKNGWHGMLGLGISAGTNVELMPKVEYHKFEFDFADNDGSAEGGRSIWMFGGDVKFGLGQPYSPVKPFLLGGVGVANLRYERFTGPIAAIENIDLPNDESKFYWNLGAGMDFNVSEHVGLFVQGRYVAIDTPDRSTGFIPVTVGLRFF